MYSRVLKVRLCFDNTLFECAHVYIIRTQAHARFRAFEKGVVLVYKVDSTRKSDGGLP